MALPVALTIAGSDSLAGAGIQADVPVLLDAGVTPRCVVTMVTAQDSRGVRDSILVPGPTVSSQLAAVISTGRPEAAKTGALGCAETVQIVAEAAAAGFLPNLVVDPLAAASAGGALIDPEGARALAEVLVPLARVITPNLAEAGELVDEVLESVADVVAAGPALLELGCEAVVVTGGHLAGDPVDVVVTRSGTTRITGERVDCADLHGTGCVHSAALTAGLALGEDVPTAARRARTVVESRLKGRQGT